MHTDNTTLIIQFLERVVDENIKTAERMAKIEFLEEDIRKDVEEILHMLQNGLKAEIKSHVSEEFDSMKEEYRKLVEKHDELYKEVKEHRDRNEQLDKIVSDVRKKGLWVRALIAIVVSAATVAGAVIGISRLADSSPKTQQVQPSTQNTGP